MTRQAHILCVDDEANILHSLRRLFRREPYQVHLAPSADEAFKVLEEHPIDLIISDNRMPGMTGVEFLAEVKLRWPDTVRIILSGYTEVGSITQAINEGHIYKFILKPWEDDKLLATVRECLSMADWARQNKHIRKLEGERRQVLTDALGMAQAILDALPVPVIGVAEETIVFTNQAAEVAFGSGAGSLLVRRLGEAFSAQLGEAVGHVQSGQAPAEFGYTHRGGDGYRAVCAPLPGPEHQGGAVICLIKHDGPERGAGLADLNTALDTTGENKEGPGRPHGGPDA